MLPALAFGAFLRALLLSYSPYAYWGSDSNSYYSFAELLLGSGKFSLYEKRRYLYPIFLLPVSLLPGATLRWLAWLQHGFGLATLFPLAYAVRKSFRHWRIVLPPVTLLYAGMPILLWYEHELLAENVFFALVVWSCAGWIAWVSEPRPARSRRLWWCFVIPFSALILTKPAGRFFLPGAVLALIAVRSWRALGWREWLPLAGAVALSLTIGQESQGAWLLYNSAFPLTRLETPLHAEYKAEIRDLVEGAHRKLEGYRMYGSQEWKLFLKEPQSQSERPLWKELGADEAKKVRVYKDLALEGIRHRPDLFLLISARKILSSANPEDFKSERFQTDYFVSKFEHLYEKYANDSPGRWRRLFGLRKEAPLPPFSEVAHWLNPHPDSRASAFLTRYVNGFQRWARLEYDDSDSQPNSRRADTPTFLGWWLLGGAALSLTPAYFRRIGLWAIVITGYLFGVYLVGGSNARFFGAAWGILILLVAMPVEVGLDFLGRFRRGGKQSPQPEAA